MASKADNGERSVLGFQGQGTQEQGMGAELHGIPEADEVFAEADEISEKLIGEKISKITLDGPQELLSENSQLAIFVVSAAASAVLIKRLKSRPFGVTGHSLGEYGALLAAGVFSLKSGIAMIHERQKAMLAADNEIPGGGGMASVLGLDEESLVRLANKLGVDVAAINTHTTGTLSGPKSLIEQAPAAAENESTDSVKTKVLAINSAAHSRWNALAAVLMEPIMKDIEFHRPRFNFFANNGLVISDPGEIKAHLLRMFEDPVRFRDVSLLMASSGVKRFTEVGKNNLLSKFVKKTAGQQIETEISSKKIEEEAG